MDGDLRNELTEFRDKLRVPAVIGVVTDQHELVDADVIGVRSRADDQPVALDDQWHIGSCGKSITALLYARLVEAGVAEWDIPVATLFEDIDNVHPEWATPTIDDLLRCRAGVPANPNTAQMLAAQKSTDPVTEQRTTATERVLATSPKKPGDFVYSNLGYGLVGAAIDRLTGIPYEDALFTYVLEPLGVTTAGFGPPPVIRGHHPRLRLGPALVGRGAPAEPNQRKPADNPALLTPAGRLHLSIPDWAIIQRVFLNDGAPLLRGDSIEHLLFDPGSNDKGRSMSMGWASGAELGATFAMQGSNTMWAATALMDRETRRTALTVTNDGRMSVIVGSAHLASRLLTATL